MSGDDRTIRGNETLSFHAHKQSTISGTTVPSTHPNSSQPPLLIPPQSSPPPAHRATHPPRPIPLFQWRPVRSSNWCSAKCWAPLPPASGPSQLSHALISYPLAIENGDRCPPESVSLSACVSPSLCVRLASPIVCLLIVRRPIPTRCLPKRSLSSD